MSTEANKQTVRTFFDHLHSGAFDDAFALLTPDATWWIPTDQPGIALTGLDDHEFKIFVEGLLSELH